MKSRELRAAQLPALLSQMADMDESTAATSWADGSYSCMKDRRRGCALEAEIPDRASYVLSTQPKGT